MFVFLARFIYRRRWPVLVAGLVFILASIIYGTTLFGQLKGGGFDNPEAESTKAAEAFHSKLGRDEGALVVLFNSSDSSNVDNPAFKQSVETTLNRIKDQPGIGSVTTYYNSGATSLVSTDRLSTYAVVGLKGNDDEQATTLKALRPLLTSEKLQVRLGGLPAVNQEMNAQVEKDLQTAETMSFPILAVLLVFIFGSLVAAALPLAIGGMVILGAFLILRVVSNFSDISIFAINIITMLGLGLAIDYSLFMISRFREELKRRNGDVEASLARTMQTAGRTVMFSALTVIISLLSLLVFPQMFLKSMGMGGAAAVFVAMLAALTILPAVLALLGNRINSLSVRTWLPGGRNRKANEQSGFWFRISNFVMRRPATVLVVTLVPLILVGLPFLQVTLSTPDARSLPPKAESRVVSEILTSQFPRNETEPVEVVIRTEKAALDPATLSALYDYTRQVAAIPGVRRVDSLVNLDPRMDKGAYTQFYSEAGLNQNPQAAAVARQFSNGNYTLVNVLYDSEPLSKESQELVKHIRELSAPAGFSVQVGGNSAFLVDFLDSLYKSIPVAFGLIVMAVFVILFLMLGSLVIPLKAVILNVLSLSVSFGALVWIFQEGHFADLLGFTSLGSIDGTQPVLIFAIAFGLSMDYEVFLLSRVKEHYDRSKDTAAAVANGVQKTGAIITSAAILLVVVIASFATGEVLFIKEIGVGLSLAILVDATIVRMLLVPASMRLLGRYNWWAPAPLARLYNRLGLAETEHEETPVLIRDGAEAIEAAA
ncbi:MAG TPA: MMPL family transporter [Chloroflexia bacterium]|nr:MMPL family transporter [Chloroflexia bacterium]